MDKLTLEYYEQNAKEYSQKTLELDISSLRKTFASLIPQGSQLLDLGCGSGRDLKEFQKQGFDSIGLELCNNLKAFACSHSGCRVVFGDARNLPFPEESFDAIWCCAVLLHLPEDDAKNAVSEMMRVSRRGASLFLSLKKGKGSKRTDDGRYFQLYEKEDIERLLEAYPFALRAYKETISQDGTTWLNAFVRVEDDKKKKHAKTSLYNSVSWGQMLLKEAGIEEGRLESEWFLEHTIQKDRMELYQNPEKLLTKEQQDTFFACLQKRVQRCPFAYITGKAHFMEFVFKVNPDVLIPRPETEGIIEYCMQAFPKDKPLLGLDIGTGSGCIAISMLKYFPHAYLVATDLSPRALAVASENSYSLGVQDRLILCQADLLPPFMPNPVFDFILSNPPYISEKDYLSLMPEVKNFEPSLALLAGDGLDFYRRILTQALPFLKEKGILILEIGYGQSEAIQSLPGNQLRIREILKDLAGIDRILVLEKIISHS